MLSHARAGMAKHRMEPNETVPALRDGVTRGLNEVEDTTLAGRAPRSSVIDD